MKRLHSCKMIVRNSNKCVHVNVGESAYVNKPQIVAANLSKQLRSTIGHNIKYCPATVTAWLNATRNSASARQRRAHKKTKKKNICSCVFCANTFKWSRTSHNDCVLAKYLQFVAHSCCLLTSSVCLGRNVVDLIWTSTRRKLRPMKSSHHEHDQRTPPLRRKKMTMTMTDGCETKIPYTAHKVSGENAYT